MNFTSEIQDKWQQRGNKPKKKNGCLKKRQPFFLGISKA
jgi:hypothetical protein